MHGEVRLFAVHGHHPGELLQLKCTGRRGKRLQELKNSHGCAGVLCLSSNDAVRCIVRRVQPWARRSQRCLQSPRRTYLSTVSHCWGWERLLHLSASDLVKPVLGCSRETLTARTASRLTDRNCSQGRDYLETTRLHFKNFVHFIQPRNRTGPSAFRPHSLLTPSTIDTAVVISGTRVRNCF